MKKVILFAMTIFAAHAAFAEDTIIKGYPTSSVGGHLITVEELCIDGQEVRTIKAHKYCVKMSNDESSRCIRYKKEIYRNPVNSCHEECKEWAMEGDNYICIKKAKVPYSFAQTYKVPVYRIVGDGIFKLIHSFEFNIPACQEIE